MIHIKDQKFIVAFGKHLRKLRKEGGFTQEQLAFTADIPISQIGRIERGKINTTISTILSISKALDVHHKELLDFSY